MRRAGLRSRAVRPCRASFCSCAVRPSLCCSALAVHLRNESVVEAKLWVSYAVAPTTRPHPAPSSTTRMHRPSQVGGHINRLERTLLMTSAFKLEHGSSSLDDQTLMVQAPSSEALLVTPFNMSASQPHTMKRAAMQREARQLAKQAQDEIDRKVRRMQHLMLVKVRVCPFHHPSWIWIGMPTEPALNTSPLWPFGGVAQRGVV